MVVDETPTGETPTGEAAEGGSDRADAVATGRVEAIHVTAAHGAPMESRQRVAALAGLGLEGDRSPVDAGGDPSRVHAGSALTLVESEVIESLLASDEIHLAPGATRRNLTTRGIRLNDLVGRRFRVGPVVCQGIKLCEPCSDLEASIGRPILRPLAHRAGLRADILEGGDIALGDAVVALD